AGRVRLPDGTRLQIAIKRPNGGVAVAMAQVLVEGSQFDTPPLLGESGPLPRADYRFEVLAHFDADSQSNDVLRALNGAQGLRGRGTPRGRDGAAAFSLTREARL